MYLQKHSVASEEKEATFPREMAERLGVSPDVISVIMKIEHSKALRKRLDLLIDLDESKQRIFKSLRMGSDQEEDLSMFDRSVTPEMIKHQVHQMVYLEKLERSNEKWHRHVEQTETLNYINCHIKRCKESSEDMDEMVEWMNKFTFDVTWDDIEMKPLEDREEEENQSFSNMIYALQRSWQCTKRLTHLIQLFASDDQYDYIAGKIPPNLLTLTKRKNTSFTELWCSSKLRTRFNQFENLRSKIKDDPKRPEFAAMQRKITVLHPGDVPSHSALKELEAVIFREISESWEQACEDVAFYLRETMFHKFTKPSCQKRLRRALLLLEFLTAAINGKLEAADRIMEELQESHSKLSRLKKESGKIQKELVETKKELATTRQTVNKLKKQIKSVSKENEKLMVQTIECGQQIRALERSVAEYKSRPSQEEYDDYMHKIESLQNELSKLKKRNVKLKYQINLKEEEIEKLKARLTNSKRIHAELNKELQQLKQDKEDALREVGLLKEKLSLQDFRVKSIQDSFDSDIKSSSSPSEEQPVGMKTLTSNWSLLSQSQVTQNLSDSFPSKTSSKEEKASYSAFESSVTNEGDDKLGYPNAESSSTFCTKRDPSLLEAFQDVVRSEKEQKPAVPKVPDKKKIAPPPPVELQKPVPPKKVVEKMQPPKPNIDQQLQDFASILTRHLTKAVDKDQHYQSNDEKAEAEMELQKLLQSAREAMLMETSVPPLSEKAGAQKPKPDRKISFPFQQKKRSPSPMSRDTKHAVKGKLKKDSAASTPLKQPTGTVNLARAGVSKPPVIGATKGKEVGGVYRQPAIATDAKDGVGGIKQPLASLQKNVGDAMSRQPKETPKRISEAGVSKQSVDSIKPPKDAGVTKQPVKTIKQYSNEGVSKQPVEASKPHKDASVLKPLVETRKMPENIVVSKQPAATRKAPPNVSISKEAVETRKANENIDVSKEPVKTRKAHENIDVSKEPVKFTKIQDDVGVLTQPVNTKDIKEPDKTTTLQEETGVSNQLVEISSFHDDAGALQQPIETKKLHEVAGVTKQSVETNTPLEDINVSKLPFEATEEQENSIFSKPPVEAKMQSVGFDILHKSSKASKISEDVVEKAKNYAAVTVKDTKDGIFKQSSHTKEKERVVVEMGQKDDIDADIVPIRSPTMGKSVGRQSPQFKSIPLTPYSKATPVSPILTTPTQQTHLHVEESRYSGGVKSPGGKRKSSTALNDPQTLAHKLPAKKKEKKKQVDLSTFGTTMNIEDVKFRSQKADTELEENLITEDEAHLIQRVARLGHRRRSSLVNITRGEMKQQHFDMSPTVSQIINIASDPGAFLRGEPPMAPQSSRAISTSPTMDIAAIHDISSVMLDGSAILHEGDAGKRNDIEETNSDAALPPQADAFAKRISEMISNYFTKLNVGLIESLKREKNRLEDELGKLEQVLATDRLEAQARIDALNREKERLEHELVDATKTVKKLSGYSKFSPMIGTIPKILQDYSEEKLKLIKMSQNLTQNMQHTELHNKSLEAKLEAAKIKVRVREKNISKQNQEIMGLRVQLVNTRREEMRKLFLSLKSHRINYRMIMENKDISPELKMTVLNLLRRSMSYPKYCLNELAHRYVRKKEMDTCMERIKLHIPDVVQLPPVHMSAQKFKESFDARERQKLRSILNELKRRSDVAGARWRKRMKEMTGRRQKLLMSLALLFHKLQTEHKDISLIHPVVQKMAVSERPETRLRRIKAENVEKLDAFESYHLPLIVPGSRKTKHPVTPTHSATPIHGLESSDGVKMKGQGSFNQSNILLNKSCSSQLYCPFGNETGTASLHKVTPTVKAQNYSKFLRLPVLSKSKMNLHYPECKTLGIPKLLELDVQSGLRQAKKILFARTQNSNRELTDQRKPMQPLPFQVIFPLIRGRRAPPSSLNQTPRKNSPTSPTLPVLEGSTPVLIETVTSSEGIITRP